MPFPSLENRTDTVCRMPNESLQNFANVAQILTLAGLVFYCKETWKLRRAAQTQNEIAYRPVITLSIEMAKDGNDFVHCLFIRNVGNGPALEVTLDTLVSVLGKSSQCEARFRRIEVLQKGDESERIRPELIQNGSHWTDKRDYQFQKWIVDEVFGSSFIIHIRYKNIGLLQLGSSYRVTVSGQSFVCSVEKINIR